LKKHVGAISWKQFSANEIKAPAFPKYNNVIYNKDAEDWIRNNYPTVVGFVGTRN
jgi:hypothetical protein